MLPDKTPAVLLILLALHFGYLVRCQAEPCVVPDLTQADLAELINPRPSGGLTVLVKLPFDRVFCSATVYRYLIIGNWSERHQLVLNESQAFNGSVHPDVASRSAWQAIDVTEASRRVEFDFLVDESRGLAKDTEYFVALSGCDTLRCRTAGFVKVPPWRQADETGTQNHNYILIGIVCGVLLLGAVAVGILLWFCRSRKSKYTDGSPYASMVHPPEPAHRNADRTENLRRDYQARNSNPRSSVEAPPPVPVAVPHTYLECDRHPAQGVDSVQHAATGFQSEGYGYSTYAEINSNFNATGNTQASNRQAASSSGFEETSLTNSVVPACQEDYLNGSDGRLRGVQNRAFEVRYDMSGTIGSKNDNELRDSGASGVASGLETISNPDLTSVAIQLAEANNRRIYKLQDRG